MKDDKPSFSAAMVAFGRGIGVPGLPRDTWAQQLCPEPLSRLLRWGESRPPLRGLLARGTGGLAWHMALRTAMIDAGVRAGLDDGANQVVLLGAGLDARALRLAELAKVTVFEVDHPSTQAMKRHQLGVLPDNLVFVPVDFEADALPAALEAAGYRRSEATVWVWEGVTMYLSRLAIEQTLADMACLSAPGSRLMLTYIRRGVIPFSELAGALGKRLFSFSGESLQTWFASGEWDQLLAESGFTLQADSSDSDWARQLGIDQRFAGAFCVEYLAAASYP